MKAAYPKAIPVSIQKRAELAKARHDNILGSIHTAVKQLEIMGKDNEGVAPRFQRLPE